jgi:hypothetical protein
MKDFLGEHAVSLDYAGFSAATRELAYLIDKDATELELQKFLERHPYVLSQQFTHCHHVFPNVRLGERYTADFFCLDIPSSGKEWIGVEIEEPGKKVITKAGRRTAKLEHALQQVRDWRKWITDNIDYARRSRDKNGLGLDDIQPRSFACVIIGRRKDYSDEFNRLRQQIFRDELIDIRSWDGILERAVQRAEMFSNWATHVMTAKPVSDVRNSR